MNYQKRPTPEKFLSPQDKIDIELHPNIYVHGGDGTPHWLEDTYELDVLLAGDVFADNARHEFFSEPIYHTDGNVYVQVRYPILVKDRYNRKFVRFEENTYLNTSNQFNR